MMTQFLEQLFITGFRGINEPIHLTFEKGLNILYGPNGVGKSSIIQAIEWCLTGKVTYFSGGDFRKEDAIVNLFSAEQQATVTLILTTNGDTVEITRTRPLRKTSSPGRQPLQIAAGTQIYKGNRATKYLEEHLNINEDTIQNIIIHQQTIRDILSRKPDEQSRAIDQLLGIGDVRDFIDALDPKRSIINAKRDLQARIEDLQHDRIQFATKLRGQLDQEQQTLLSQGYTKQQLSLPATITAIQELHQQAGQLIDTFAAPYTIKTSVEPNLDACASSLKELKTLSRALDRYRGKSLADISSRIVHLQNLARQCAKAQSDLANLGEIPVTELQTQQTSLSTQLATAKQHVATTQQTLSTVTNQISTLRLQQQTINQTTEQITNLGQEYGSLEDLQDTIAKCEDHNTQIDHEIATLSTKQQLARLAVSLLHDTHPATCPICDQQFDVQVTLERLKTSSNPDLIARVTQHQETKNNNNRTIAKLTSIIHDLQQLRTIKTHETATLHNTFKNLTAVTGTTIDRSTDLETLQNTYVQQQKDQNHQVLVLSQKLNEVTTQLASPTTLQQTIKNLQTEIQLELDTSSDSPLSQQLDTTITSLQEQKTSYERIQFIDQLDEQIASVEFIIDFLQQQEQLHQIEQELPHITNAMTTLQANIEALTILEHMLLTIRKSVIQYEKDIVNTELQSLEDEVNHYYAQIQGHPYFSKISMEIENKLPLQYVFKAENQEDGFSSYILTRFSQAQMNIAALAIFLSNNHRLAGNLPLLILDDPTQSVDETHIRALSQLLHTLSTERQILLATHDALFQKLLQTPDANTITLTNWNIPGPHIDSS
jgi:exonuclease SbcC